MLASTLASTIAEYVNILTLCLHMENFKNAKFGSNKSDLDKFSYNNLKKHEEQLLRRAQTGFSVRFF
jgi:hypothetical protein